MRIRISRIAVVLFTMACADAPSPTAVEPLSYVTQPPLSVLQRGEYASAALTLDVMWPCLDEAVVIDGELLLGYLVVQTATGVQLSVQPPSALALELTGMETGRKWSIEHYAGPFVSARDGTSLHITETARFRGLDGGILVVRAHSLVTWHADAGLRVESRAGKCYLL